MDTKMNEQTSFVSTQWMGDGKMIEVRDPQDHSLIDKVPAASAEDMLYAIEQGKEGVKIAEAMSTHQRMSILNKTAELIESRHDRFATLIAREGSKTINEARTEVTRCIQTIRISAEETRRIQGETINFDQMPGSENRVGYYYYFPVGLVGAITPFNDPLNLVAHKIGPAIAAGNAVVLKPATVTPLSALLLADTLLEAGLPEKVLTVVTGKGSDIGDTLIEHKDVRMISFTGGLEVGLNITRKAGLKKLALELGSNSPAIVLQDADFNKAVEATVSGAFFAVGQNCLGVQRIFVEESIFDEFTRAFVELTEKQRMGNKMDESTDMGPLIEEKEAKRIESWVNEAVDEGAQILCGGKRDGAFYSPTVLKDVSAQSKVAHEEVFGPVVSLFPVADLDDAVEQANSVDFGIQAGIFTRDIDKAFAAIQKLKVGGVMINDSSDYRVDAMPFGGVKSSGLGREGIKFAIKDMTEPRVVCFKLNNG